MIACVCACTLISLCTTECKTRLYLPHLLLILILSSLSLTLSLVPSITHPDHFRRGQLVSAGGEGFSEQLRHLSVSVFVYVCVCLCVFMCVCLL